MVKQWQAIYYPLACPVIAIKVAKSYLRGIERGTTGLKSVKRRSRIGLINNPRQKERAIAMIALSFCLFIRLRLWLTFGLGLHFHGSGFVALHFYYRRLSSRFNLIDHHSILVLVTTIAASSRLILLRSSIS